MSFQKSDSGFTENSHHSEPIVYFDPCDMDTIDDVLMEKTSKMSRLQAIKFVRQYYDTIVEQVQEKTKAKVLRGCVGILIDAKNAKLASYGIAFAAGFDHLAGLTMTQASIELHVTKAAISKCAIHAALILDIPRSRYMKSKEASESYRQRQLNKNKT